MSSLLERAVKYLAIRPHSKKEVFLYLSKKTDEKDEIEKTLTKLEESSLLDDKSFARSWAEFRLKNHNPKGFHIIKQELFQKGVEGNIVEEILADEEIQELEKEAKEIALERLSKKYQEPEKIRQEMYRKGF